MTKTEKVVKDVVKTAVVVAGAYVTLSGCNNARNQNNHQTMLTQEQMKAVVHKVDSAKYEDNRYVNMAAFEGFYQENLQKYKNANKEIARAFVKMAIKAEVKDKKLYNFMMSSLASDEYCFEFVVGYSDGDFDSDGVVSQVGYIRENYRWFNDLMLYLSNVYDDEQLLNSGFFDVVKNNYAKQLKQKFASNTEDMKTIKSNMLSAKQQKYSIVKTLREQYINASEQTKKR